MPETTAKDRRSSTLGVEWLGEVGYRAALDFQEEAVRDRLAGRTGDRLLLLEHSKVVTLGRGTKPENLLQTPEALRAAGVEVFEVGRGGDVTFHGPGQLVGYPVIDLDALARRDVHDHLRRIEAGLIGALEELGVPARRIDGWTGVFIDRARSARAGDVERKIASIGVGVRRWVTLHGFALNVSLDLRGFESIVPCGLGDIVMTSVAAELAATPGAPAADESDLDRHVRDCVAVHMTRALGAS